ncbi:hypothetical protein niasHT_038756 [Heterodera trifolii]|uniref:Uncharacterized protein n=1 Tax=Heterodera trifolii TaxID=157864 RepID=A0ABD2IWZ4_9BILA
MFSTHSAYALVSVILCSSIYKYVEWKGGINEWGDGIRGLALSTAQYSLMQISKKSADPKNWRMFILLLLLLAVVAHANATINTGTGPPTLSPEVQQQLLDEFVADGPVSPSTQKILDEADEFCAKQKQTNQQKKFSSAHRHGRPAHGANANAPNDGPAAATATPNGPNIRAAACSDVPVFSSDGAASGN